MDAVPDPRTAELLAHARWIETLARRLVDDQASASDLVQNTWLAALRTPTRPSGNVRGWLARIVGNVARETHRRESARADVERNAARHESLPSSAELAARAEAETKLVEAVLTLEEPHREVLLLRYFEGLRPEEIARRSGVPASNVSKQLTRAHARLRARLEERGMSWLAAVAPIVGRTSATVPPSSSVPLAVPIVIMSTAVKIAVPLVLVAALALWLTNTHDDETQPTIPATVAAASEPAPVADTLAPPALESSARASAIEKEVTPPPAATAPAPPAEAAVAATPDAAPTGRVHGRVLRPDGKPAAGRRIRFLRTPTGPMRPVVADDAGRFDERDLPTGKYSISTECSKDELALVGLPADTSIMETLLQRMLDVGPGADIEIELGTPPKNPIRVSGRVAAEPMPREIMMQWIPEGEDGMDRAKFKRVAQDGTYEVVLAEAGPYNVSMIVASSPRIERTVDVPSGSEFAQDFALAAGTLRGRLRTAAGEPVVRALVELTFRAGHRPVNFMSSIAYTRTTDGEGRFSFDRLDPARYALGIYGGATAAGEKTGALSVRDVVVPNQGASTELELVAPAGHVIRGRVVDAAGGAVNYASVFVFDANGEPLDPITPAMSDKKGAFTLPPLAPGHYSLVGACGVRWTEPAALDVLEKNTDIELHLRDAATLDVSAESLGESWIDVRDAQGNCLSAVLDRNLFNGTVTRASFRSTWRYLVPAGDLEVRAIDSTGAVVASSKVSAAAGGKQLVKLAR